MNIWFMHIKQARGNEKINILKATQTNYLDETMEVSWKMFLNIKQSFQAFNSKRPPVLASCHHVETEN